MNYYLMSEEQLKLEAHLITYKKMKDDFKIFERIGKTGTCAECPRSAGSAYPEFCVNKQRSDHDLSADKLFSYYEQERAIAFTRLTDLSAMQKRAAQQIIS